MSRDPLGSYFEELDQVSERVIAPAPAERVMILELDSLEAEYVPKRLRAESFQPEKSALPSVPVTYDVSKRMWRLLGNYKIKVDGQSMTAPDGFEFDLSSIPRPFWVFIAPNELSIVAPLFHDLIYTYKGKLPKKLLRPFREFTRLETDQLFLRLMEMEGVPLWRRVVAYKAVRCFGGTYWAT